MSSREGINDRPSTHCDVDERLRLWTWATCSGDVDIDSYVSPFHSLGGRRRDRRDHLRPMPMW